MAMAILWLESMLKILFCLNGMLNSDFENEFIEAYPKISSGSKYCPP